MLKKKNKIKNILNSPDKKKNGVSYKDSPDGGYFYEVKSSRIRVSKKALKLVIILMFSIFVILFWTNRHNLSPGNVVNWVSDKILGIGIGPGYPVHIVGNAINDNNFQIIEDNAVMVSDTAFVALNKSAKELSNRQHSFRKPILKVNGAKALIYDLDGKNIQIESRSLTIYKSEMPNNIIAGDICENGSYIIATESKGYLAQITVYSSDNSEKYKYYFSGCYITDVALTANGNFAAVSGICADNGILNSVLYEFDFRSDKPKCSFEFNDNLLTYVQYASNGNIIAIGDNSTSILNVSKNQKTDYNYNGKKLTAFEVKADRGILLSLAYTPDGRNCNIVNISKNGKVELEMETELKVHSVSFNNDIISLLCENKIYDYSHSGKLKEEIAIGNDTKEIRLLSSNNAYILGTSEIKFMKLH